MYTAHVWSWGGHVAKRKRYNRHGDAVNFALKHADREGIREVTITEDPEELETDDDGVHRYGDRVEVIRSPRRKQATS